MEQETLGSIAIVEQLKKVNRQRQEYWSSRELAIALGYKSYRSFAGVISKAKKACQLSGYKVGDHFHPGTEKFKANHGKSQLRITLTLSRYACYLIIQNANPEKIRVAVSQTYLAIQAHKQELLDQGEIQQLSVEEQSRLLLRNEISEHNKHLAELARQAGVVSPDDFSAFQNQGYMGLYGGLDREHLHQKKRLNKSQKVLDYMGSTELAANLFRATQAEEKLQNDHVKNKLLAFKIHHDIGEKVRQTIAELGGTMPEDLSTPSKSIKYVERKKAHTDNKDINKLFLGAKHH